MTSSVLELIQTLYDSDVSNETRAAAEKELTELEMQEQVLIDLFDIYSACSSDSVKRKVALSIKRSIVYNLEFLKESQQTLNHIKASLLSFLGDTSNIDLQTTIIYVMEPLMKIESENWPELYEHLIQYSTSESESDFICTMTLIRYLSAHMSPANLESNTPFFIDLFNRGSQSSNPSIVQVSTEMIAAVISRVDGATAMMYAAPIEHLIMLFFNSFSAYQRITHGVARSLDVIFSATTFPLDPLGILNEFFNFIVNQIPDTDFLSIAFIPLDSLITRHPKAFSKYAREIITVCRDAASRVVIEGSAEDNEEASFISSIAGVASRVLKTPDFFEIMWECFAVDTFELSVASIMVVLSSTEYQRSSLLVSLNEYLQRFCELLQSPAPLIKELSLQCLCEACKYVDSEQASIVISCVEEYLFYDDPNIVRPALLVLLRIFNAVEIDTALVPKLTEELLELASRLESKYLLHYTIEVISAFVLSSGSSILPYTSSLYPLLYIAATKSEEDDPILKGYGIEAIANLIRFAPSVLGSDVMNFLELVIGSMNSNDFSLKTSILICLDAMVRARIPELLEKKMVISDYIVNFFNGEIFEFTSETEDVRANSMPLNALTNALKLMKSIYKLYEELIPEDYKPWLLMILAMTKVPFSDLESEAVNTAVYALKYAYKKDHADLSEFINDLIERMDDAPNEVTIAFKALRDFIKAGIELSPVIISQAVEHAFSAIAHALNCFDEDYYDDNEEAFDSYSMKRVYAFLDTVIDTHSTLFDYNKFVTVGRTTLSKIEDPEEIRLYLSFLKKVVSKYGPEMQSIAKSYVSAIYREYDVEN